MFLQLTVDISQFCKRMDIIELELLSQDDVFLTLIFVLTTFIGKSLETLRQSAEVAFKKYTQKDKSLCKELQENRAEQDKLQQRLNQLKQHEQKLEEDRKKRSEDQQTAEMVRQTYKAPGITFLWRGSFYLCLSSCGEWFFKICLAEYLSNFTGLTVLISFARLRKTWAHREYISPVKSSIYNMPSNFSLY